MLASISENARHAMILNFLGEAVVIDFFFTLAVRQSL